MTNLKSPTRWYKLKNENPPQKGGFFNSKKMLGICAQVWNQINHQTSAYFYLFLHIFTNPF